MTQAMAGPHPWDYTSLEAPPQDYARELRSTCMKGKRIAYTRDLGHARVDPEIAEVTERAVSVFQEMGAHIEEVAPAWGPLGPELVRFFWPATFSGRIDSLPEFESRMDPGFVAMIRHAASFTAPQFMKMRQRRFEYVQQIHEF